MKRYLACFLLIGLMSITILGCQSSKSTGFSDADKAAIRKVTDEVVSISNAATKDWAAYVKTDYAEDAVIFPPNTAAVQGWDAIQSFVTAMPASSDFKVDVLEIEGWSDLAYVRGTYSMTYTLPGDSGPTKESGKYIEVWRRQPDGSWKVIRDIWNSDLPMPAPPASAPAKSPKK